MARKLFLVTYTIPVYVLAEDAIEAMEVGKEGVSDVVLFDHADPEEVTPKSRLVSDWENDSLVYTRSRKEEIKLGDVWPKENT
jgi:hypothetical protein